MTKMIKTEEIENLIFTFRDEPVMVDRDLAQLYQVETKVLNQSVKRNLNRFPEMFRFQLNDKERDELVTNCDRFENLKHSSVNPYAFTEQGVAMLSAVLRSDIAVEVSIQIIQAFVSMKRFISTNANIFQRLDTVEKRQFITDKKIDQVFKALEDKSITPKEGVFFDGQVFDAYLFISDIIKKAESSIILIDNFIDETVLTMLSKRSEKVSAIIYTKQISKQLKLDLTKHNQQYSKVKIKVMPNSHDRFLIIDNKELYHIGASLKDLGKKWFAFSRMDSLLNDVLAKLKQ
ncbi:MAG: ORF6N domain-containing protein [Dysgonamonadaceae bacterium]|nr:ORF6N domain-containing protein [Dysgonamonadaceae bacterium]